MEAVRLSKELGQRLRLNKTKSANIRIIFEKKKNQVSRKYYFYMDQAVCLEKCYSVYMIMLLLIFKTIQ